MWLWKIEIYRLRPNYYTMVNQIMIASIKTFLGFTSNLSRETLVAIVFFHRNHDRKCNSGISHQPGDI